MNKITEIVNGRICAILLPGASILELEKEILYYKDIDICWCGLNNFSKIENNILKTINKHFEIIQDCSEVKYAEDYEQQVRIPKIEKYLSRNENNLFLTSPEIIANWHRFNKLDLFIKYSDKIRLFDYGIQYNVPNSLTLLLMYLGRYSNAKFIILFGCDGYNGSSEDINAILQSYYNPEEVLDERFIGFKDGSKSGLIGEMKSFDNSILNYYNKFSWQNNVLPPIVYNCSPITTINTFPVKNYAEIRKLCGVLIDTDSELVTDEILKINQPIIDEQNKKRESLLKNITELKKIFQEELSSKIKNNESLLKSIDNQLNDLTNRINQLKFNL